MKVDLAELGSRLDEYGFAYLITVVLLQSTKSTRSALPVRETWKGLDVYRPRFPTPRRSRCTRRWRSSSRWRT